MKKIFVHLGAGAGDLDSRANYRCGFTELIKKKINKEDKAFVIEANIKNLNKLEECYKNFKNVNILNFAISHKNTDLCEFFFTKDDAPHYQVCSLDINHVKKHYPNSVIESFKVKGLKINEFFSKYVGEKIDYLSIDLEGIDYEVMMQINLLKFQIENISIEHLHLNRSQKKNMVNHLNKNGYSYFGNGYDHKNFDYLFKKEKIIWNRFLSNFLWLVSHKKVKYFNKFFLKGSE